MEKNLPAILIAHGGPIGISDSWDLSGSWENTEAQFLATRGYAVVQTVGAAGSAAVLRSVDDAPAGTTLRVRVGDGAIAATSEGPADGE